jgi:acetylornithine/succinyldiaminopimelate/putrescine aminotransferase
MAEHEPYMVATYARPPPVFVRGKGAYLWDMEDRKYLDFTSGIAVNSLGHCDPEFSKIIADQVGLPAPLPPSRSYDSHRHVHPSLPVTHITPRTRPVQWLTAFMHPSPRP